MNTQFIHKTLNLNLLEKGLLSSIKILEKNTGCRASNEYFSKYFGKGIRTIQRALSNLRKAGHIYDESFNGRNRILRTKVFEDPFPKKMFMFKGPIRSTQIQEKIETIPRQFSNNNDNEMSWQTCHLCHGSCHCFPRENVMAHTLYDNIRDIYNITPPTPSFLKDGVSPVGEVVVSSKKKKQKKAMESKPPHKEPPPSKIYDCVKDLAIPHEDKRQICRNPEEIVKKAVAYVTNPTTIIKKTIQQAIKWAITNHNKLSNDQVQSSKDNRSWAEKEAKFWKRPRNVKLEFYNSYLELDCNNGLASGSYQPEILKYKDHGFRDRFDSILRKAKCIRQNN